MTRDDADRESAQELQAAAMAVISDTAEEGRHLRLRRDADETCEMHASLSPEGVANLLRLLAAVDDVIGRRATERATPEEMRERLAGRIPVSTTQTPVEAVRAERNAR